MDQNWKETDGKKIRKIESFASFFIHGLLFLDTFYVYQFFSAASNPVNKKIDK